MQAAKCYTVSSQQASLNLSPAAGRPAVSAQCCGDEFDAFGPRSSSVGPASRRICVAGESQGSESDPGLWDGDLDLLSGQS